MISLGHGDVRNLLSNQNLCLANQFLEQLAQIVLIIKRKLKY